MIPETAEEKRYGRARLRVDKARLRWQAAQREMDAAARELEDALLAEHAAAKIVVQTGGRL